MDDNSLGTPLPLSEHATSVSLPKWEHIIGYEENDPNVVNKLQCGYPRFVYNKIISSLFDKIANELNYENVIILPSYKSCEKCISYIKQKTGIGYKITEYKNLFVIGYKDEHIPEFKDFWQHTGLTISSRFAQNYLSGKRHIIDNSKDEIKQRISKIVKTDTSDIYLYPTGMAAIFDSYQISYKDMACQIGFPYVDTLKIQEKFGNSKYIIFNGENYKDLDRIEENSVVFCEFPTNPLLISIDLEKLYEVTKSKNAILVIDDTIASFANVHTIDYCDILVSSLTKFFSGTGDVMAGSLILNKNSNNYKYLKSQLDNNYEDLLYADDANILNKNSKDFINRIKIINQNTKKLIDFLDSTKFFKKIYYTNNSEIYNKYKSLGYGGLFSILTYNEEDAIKLYNMLEIAKGPSLGTNFTLACPYTLLAHYNELDFVKKSNVSKYLIRVSVGLENINEIINSFSKAINSCK